MLSPSLPPKNKEIICFNVQCEHRRIDRVDVFLLGIHVFLLPGSCLESSGSAQGPHSPSFHPNPPSGRMCLKPQLNHSLDSPALLTVLPFITPLHRCLVAHDFFPRLWLPCGQQQTSLKWPARATRTVCRKRRGQPCAPTATAGASPAHRELPLLASRFRAS